MKLELTQGCIADNFTINNESIHDIPEYKLREYAHKVIDKIDRYMLHIILIDITKELGDYSCSNRACECCGDIIETYKLDVE